VLARTFITWEHDGTSRNQRPQRMAMANEAGETRSVTYEYTSYNNVHVLKEFGFADELLRRTETDYETGSGWTNQRLLHLPKSVKVFDERMSPPLLTARTAYDYDTETLVQRPGITMHDGNTDAYRGNVTQIKRYADASAVAGLEVDTLTYDIAGNVVTATADCCRQKAFTYSPDFYYAYVTEEARGDARQLTTSANSDFNTGLLRSATDENYQTTTIHYYPENLRHYSDGAA